jgi:hypothetical protein
VLIGIAQVMASTPKFSTAEAARSEGAKGKRGGVAIKKKARQRDAAGEHQVLGRNTPKRSKPKRTTAADDLQAEAVRGGLERAGKQINALTLDVKRYEGLVLARTRDMLALRSIIARLKDDKLQLERRVSELARRSEALRVANRRKGSQISALSRSNNRLNNERFWSICHFIAGSSDFEAFARSVDYDVTRLFTMLLVAEIRDARDVSPEIQAHAEMVSNIFDPFFYLAEYQDVALEGVNPLLHYVTRGHRHNHRPTLLFDPDYYATQVRQRMGDALIHYVGKGVAAGLKPHPLFDTAFYLKNNMDVAASGANPLFHYQTWGGRERRNPSLLFDTQYYLENTNFSAGIGNPLQEYLSDVGNKSIDPHPLFHSAFFCEHVDLASPDEAAAVLYEKRADLNRVVSPHPLFDLDFMRNSLDVEFPENVSPLEAFCRMSLERDIDPSMLFESKLYRYQVEIERGEQLNEPPIIDYLKRGYKDKTLLPNIVFDPKTYRANVKKDFSGAELTHYCVSGDRLGSFTHPLFSAQAYNAGRGNDVSQLTAIEHFLGSPASDRHESHPAAERPLPPDTLEFVQRVYSDQRECDPLLYRQIYPDLADLSEDDALRHFAEYGRKEGRIASPGALVRRCNLRVRDLPLGFYADEYVSLNPDLSAAGVKPEFFPAFSHYLEFGRAENRTIGKWQFHLDAIDLRIPTPASPVAVEASKGKIDVCVLMHIFYPDLWPELAAFARNFETVSRDVFVNVVDIAWTPRFQCELRELCPGAFVQLSNDNGRDIGGFTRLLDNVDIAKYDLFAFMHSKKSPHVAAEKGDYWRRCLLRAFAGSPKVVAECVQMFKDDPTLGLVGAQEWRATDLGNNQLQYYRMLDRFEIEPQYRSVEYLSGTMFLLRPEIVQRIYDVLKDTDWEYGGGKDIKFHMDGQSAHAVERVIGNLVRQMGYRMAWR